jgi:hypothetical protein
VHSGGGEVKLSEGDEEGDGAGEEDSEDESSNMHTEDEDDERPANDQEGARRAEEREKLRKHTQRDTEAVMGRPPDDRNPSVWIQRFADEGLTFVSRQRPKLECLHMPAMAALTTRAC